MINERNRSNFDSEHGFKNERNVSSFGNSAIEGIERIQQQARLGENSQFIPEATESFMFQIPEEREWLTEDEVRRIAEEAVPEDLRGVDNASAGASGDRVLTLPGSGGGAVWEDASGSLRVKGTIAPGLVIGVRGWERSSTDIDWYSDRPSLITNDYDAPETISNDPDTSLRCWLPTWDYSRWI